jgi:hypothetical protein
VSVWSVTDLAFDEHDDHDSEGDGRADRAGSESRETREADSDAFYGSESRDTREADSWTQRYGRGYRLGGRDLREIPVRDGGVLGAAH